MLAGFFCCNLIKCVAKMLNFEPRVARLVIVLQKMKSFREKFNK